MDKRDLRIVIRMYAMWGKICNFQPLPVQDMSRLSLCARCSPNLKRMEQIDGLQMWQRSHLAPRHSLSVDSVPCCEMTSILGRPLLHLLRFPQEPSYYLTFFLFQEVRERERKKNEIKWNRNTHAQAKASDDIPAVHKSIRQYRNHHAAYTFRILTGKSQSRASLVFYQRCLSFSSWLNSVMQAEVIGIPGNVYLKKKTEKKRKKTPSKALAILSEKNKQTNKRELMEFDIDARFYK